MSDPVAAGPPVAGGRRTDPGGRNYRTGLLHRVLAVVQEKDERNLRLKKVLKLASFQPAHRK